MNARKKIIVTADHLYVNCAGDLTDDYESVLFNNISHDFELLLLYLNENNQSIVSKVFLTTDSNSVDHVELVKYLNQVGIEVVVNNSSSKETNENLIKRYRTENLDTKTLNNRLEFLKRVINREELRLDDLVSKNRSRSIIDMVLKSIGGYRKKRQVLETILNGR